MMEGLFIAGASQASVNQAQEAAGTASRAAADARTQNRETQLDVEKLFMITEALWKMVKEQHGYTDDQLAEIICDIDLRDGQLDGKVARQPNPPCSQCGRMLMGRHPVCLYCGAVAVRGPFER
ncbi:MAG: hypothetical protein ISS69_08925 [Phycisphaerae bacterium]|nr:hypothetical protein [Phycisphaerae bacterium]